MKEIKAKEGYYLSDKDKTIFYKSIKGENINEDDFIEITEKEVNEINKHTEVINDIDSLEKIDEYNYKVSVIPECINNIKMTNKEAIAHVSSFPKWETFINKNIDKVGFKVNYNDKLYEVLQPIKPVLEHQTPDLVPSNYGLVSEHEGTKEDPIPYERMMVIRKDKYYTQNGKLYIGILDASNGYDADLETLSTLVKEIKE